MKYFAFLLVLLSWTASAANVRVGTKNFTEGYVTGELTAQLLEREQNSVDRRFGLGGTGIVVEALKAKQIDLYVEYTGTIAEVILKTKERLTAAQLNARLAPLGFVAGPPLGFSNTYALAVRRDFARAHNLRTMTDLAKVAPTSKFGISHEFFSRGDGFPAMKAFYRYETLRDQLSLMEHTLLYQAIASNKVDVIEVYSTDGKIDELDLVVLEDDAHFFPDYQAVLLASQEFVDRSPEVWKRITEEMNGSLDTQTMRQLNAAVDLQKRSPRQVIAAHLHREAPQEEGIWPRIAKRTKEHLVLVGTTMILCILVGVPLGLFGLRAPLLAQGILLLASLIQTIPSLALLCFLIPVFGIGKAPALVALFLYGLFPIVVNTYTGVSEVARSHVEMARALGMSRLRRLFWIELPLASPFILNGIKTALILTIGTATLAALIGAGGYGAPIITGLAMNSMPTILIGAVPAAVMAVLAHVLFLGLDRILIPRGLRR